MYHPVIDHDGSGFVTQAQHFTVRTSVSYKSTVTWYVNGEKQMATGTSFMPSFTLPGQKTIIARLNSTLEQADLTVVIRSYSGIVLESLVPNPLLPDTEEVVLKNTNTYPVIVRDWRLQSQASRALVPLSVVIEPGSSVTIKVVNKLLNNGGSYGLYNEANELVDRVSYGMAPPGERLTRTQTEWRFPSFNVEEQEPDLPIAPGDTTDVDEDREIIPNDPLPTAVRGYGSIQEPRVPFQVWMRLWINVLVLSGYLLLSSCWKKSV